MSSPHQLRRVVLLAGLALVVLCAVFAYRRTEDRCRGGCWARAEAGEWGFALGPRSRDRLGLRRTVEFGDTPAAIARFLPPEHVHSDVPGMGTTQHGPYVLMTTIGCMGPMPSEFAMLLMTDPAFGDFVAARIDAGTADIATVRELIAVPSWRHRDDFVATHAELLGRGTDLVAAFRGTEPRKTELWWDVDPRDRPPRTQGCPLRPEPPR